MKLDRLFLTVLATAASVLVLGGGTAGAATGQLDPSFGNDGVASPVLGSGHRQVPVDSVRQADGRILIVGWSEPGPQGLIARLMPDGTPDQTFGDGGSVETEDIQGWDTLTLQPDGKIVTVGHVGTRLVIARFNDDGTPDTGYGVAGRFELDITSLPSPSEVDATDPRGLATRVLADGDIRVAARFNNCSGPGSCSPDLLLAGTDPEGSADPQLGTSGARRLDSSGSSLLLLSADGGGTEFSTDSGEVVDPSEPSRLTVTEIGPDGTVDETSARYSDLEFGVALDSTAARAVRDSQGRILLATDDSVLRFLQDGTLDRSFGDEGATSISPDIAHFSIKGYPYPMVNLSGIAVNPDGRILLSGTVGKITGRVGQSSGMAVRLFKSGKPDPTFGAGGMTIAWRGVKAKPSIPGRTRLLPTGPDSLMIVGLGPHGDDFGVNLASISNGDAPWLTCNGQKADYIGTSRDDEIFNASRKTIVLGGGNDRVKGETLTVCAGPGNDRIDVGRFGPNQVIAGSGNDLVMGSPHRDMIRGGPGADRILGATGDDALYGDAGDDLLRGGAGDDLIHAGDGDDRAYGGVRDDRLYGGSGSDRLSGGGGFDRLIGGPGRDALRPGPASGSRFTDYFVRSKRVRLRLNRHGNRLKVHGQIQQRCEDKSRSTLGIQFTARLHPSGHFGFDSPDTESFASVASFEGKISGRKIKGRLAFADDFDGVICSTGKRPVAFPLRQAWVPFQGKVHPRQKQMVRQ